jgi:hypothetical protein
MLKASATLNLLSSATVDEPSGGNDAADVLKMQ